jgi:hypothetical protein
MGSVELLPETDEHGAGVRAVDPASRTATAELNF